MNQFQIELSRKTIISAGLLLALLAGIAIAFFSTRAHVAPKELRSGEEFAAMAAELFFSIEYTGRERWQETLCAVSTAGACEFVESVMAPAIWPQFVAAQSVITATAKSAELVAAREDFSGEHQHIYRIELSLSEDWPGAEPHKMRAPHILIVQRGDQWLFNGLLTNEQIDALYAAEGQDADES